MKLLTKALEKRFKEIGSQEGLKDPIVITKFFHPFSDWTWYATEYNPGTGLFFGYVDGDFPELGYFAKKELESLHVRGLPIERDLYFRERPLSEVTK